MLELTNYYIKKKQGPSLAPIFVMCPCLTIFIMHPQLTNFV
jgi:hypothetical protein